MSTNLETREDCQQSCETEPRCNYWSFVKSRGFCYLKDTKNNVESIVDYVSGSKFCHFPEEDTN